MKLQEFIVQFTNVIASLLIKLDYIMDELSN